MRTLAEVVQPRPKPSAHLVAKIIKTWGGGAGGDTTATKAPWALESASARGDKAPRDAPWTPAFRCRNSPKQGHCQERASSWGIPHFSLSYKQRPWWLLGCPHQ